MSFLTPFWMYCKYNWWCWKRATFEIRCDLAHHGCQDRQDLWIRTVLTAAVDSAYFSPSNKVWCLIWPLDEEWSSSSCHISGIDSQCTSLWCVRHETSGILCYQAKGARAIAFFCPPANRPHWATAWSTRCPIKNPISACLGLDSAINKGDEREDPLMHLPFFFLQRFYYYCSLPAQ